jgi:hypothetical protein
LKYNIATKVGIKSLFVKLQLINHQEDTMIKNGFFRMYMIPFDAPPPFLQNTEFVFPWSWFSPGTPASSITKTGRHDIAEILLKVALNTINQSTNNDFQQYFSNIMATSFSDGRSRSTRREPRPWASNW